MTSPISDRKDGRFYAQTRSGSVDHLADRADSSYSLCGLRLWFVGRLGVNDRLCRTCLNQRRRIAERRRSFAERSAS